MIEIFLYTLEIPLLFCRAAQIVSFDREFFVRYDKICSLLQSGTSHFLGQNFARAFDVTFQNKDQKSELVRPSSLPPPVSSNLERIPSSILLSHKVALFLRHLGSLRSSHKATSFNSSYPEALHLAPLSCDSLCLTRVVSYVLPLIHASACVLHLVPPSFLSG